MRNAQIFATITTYVGAMGNITVFTLESQLWNTSPMMCGFSSKIDGFNYKGRGMELSDLSEYNGHLLAPDDKTGMLYEIKGDKAIPWVFLNSGPGNTTDGMKVEWLTIKDDKLYAGGHGCEYRNKTGHIVSEDSMWIKVITKSGQVRSKNWKSVYRRMRRAAGYRA
ncbi:Apyrase, partial [Ancylostoma caninum]